MLFVALASLQPATAAAQSDQVAQASAGQCRVYLLEANGEIPSELRANCGGRGISFGRASQFTTIDNKSLQATLVDLVFDGERRVFLLTVGDKGIPLLEDLTGQLALAGGRGPTSGLEGVEVDLTEFSQTGEVAVHGRPENRTSASNSKISLGQQIAAERARRAASTSGN